MHNEHNAGATSPALSPSSSTFESQKPPPIYVYDFLGLDILFRFRHYYSVVASTPFTKKSSLVFSPRIICPTIAFATWKSEKGT